MECKIKKIMRGHLVSINSPKKILEKYKEEFYKTKYYNIILGKKFVSFKKDKKIIKFNWEDIEKFYLKDCEIFVINSKKPRKRFYLKIC